MVRSRSEGSFVTRQPWWNAATGALAVIALVVAGCSSSTSSPTPTAGPTVAGQTTAPSPEGNGGATDKGITATSINLGASNTLSGAGAASCTPITDGEALWFNHMNQTGGVAGRQISFKVLDDGYDPARAIANIRTFQDGTFVFVGSCGSATAAATYKQLSQSGLGLFFPTNGVAEVVKPPSPGIFQIIPLYEDQVATLIRSAFGETGKGSVFTVVNPLGQYQSIIDNSKSVTTSLGGTFINSAVTPLGTADYTPIALQVKAAKPDYLVISMGGSDTAKFINALVAQNALPTNSIVGTSASVAGAFLTAFDPSAAAKLRFAYPIKLPLDPTTECGKLLAGTQMINDSTAVFGCANGQVLTTAMSETSPLTRANLFKTFESWTNKDAAPGVMAPLSFSSTNHIGVTTLYILTPTSARAFQAVSACPYGDKADQACSKL